jgi:hypothetical protein
MKHLMRLLWLGSLALIVACEAGNSVVNPGQAADVAGAGGGGDVINPPESEDPDPGTTPPPTGGEEQPGPGEEQPPAGGGGEETPPDGGPPPTGGGGGGVVLPGDGTGGENPNAPVPEPSGALVAAVGLLVARAALKRSGR